MQVTTSIFNWRFGFREELIVTFEPTRLRITVKPGPVDSDFYLDPDPDMDDRYEGWTGWYHGLPARLENDGMTYPADLTSRLSVLWKRWKDGRVDETEARRVLMQLFAWVDTVNQSEPSNIRDYK